MMRMHSVALGFFLVVSCSLCATTASGQGALLSKRLLVGYWHNWGGSPNSLRLTQIPQAYDVINIAFAVPTTPSGATMSFRPDPSIYATTDEFIRDLDSLKRKGKKVLIAIGGAADPINIRDSVDAQKFVSSMRDIITGYGFDGMDIDLEGQSLVLVAGDRDFRNPTSPLIKYFIQAVNGLLNQLPPSFLLTAAPETACLQGGYNTYGGIWGSYIPVIHALRDRLTYIHTQHYNTGSMLGRDGNLYQPATADFHVAMADMLMAGFAVDPGGANIAFPALLPEQVLIGLPATRSAAGSGYTDPVTVHTAVDYLTLGRSFGGQYRIAAPGGYNRFRGLMTWSANWDVSGGNAFSNSHRGYLDTLASRTVAESPSEMPEEYALEQNYPNPFNAATTSKYRIPDRVHVSIRIYDLLGRDVATLVNTEQQAGIHSVIWEPSHTPSGAYIVRMTAGNVTKVRTMILLR
jgi:chitinase